MKINYDYARAKTYNFRPRFLILHYTAQNFETSVELLTEGVSSHYLVSLNQEDDSSYPFDVPQIFNLVDEQDRAWHAGVSAFGNRVNLNDSSIGIEIVNLVESTDNFLPYPDYQIDMVIKLCKNILARFPDISPQNVLGHADIAFDGQRKSDPGPLFPWKKLYNQGIGAWFEQETFEMYKQKLQDNICTKEEAFEKIQEYGYALDYQSNPAAQIVQEDLVRAFQMHFRPSNYDGVLDNGTAAKMLALWDKYVLNA